LVPADPAKPALGPSNGGWSNPRTLPYGVWITGADLHMLSLYNSMLSTRRFVWLREFTNPRTEFTNPRTAHRAPVAPTPLSLTTRLMCFFQYFFVDFGVIIRIAQNNPII
jgi:hypothetical protein